MTPLPDTIEGLQRAITSGQLTAAQSLAEQRSRMLTLNSRHQALVQAFCDDTPVPVNSSATLGSLNGVAFAHKDIFDTANRCPGLGRDRGARANGLKHAPVLARLQQQGAAHLGALVMAEYACGATGENANFPRCINPLNPSAAVGGSSSGSAVAVASQMVYGSLGTDTAGSVRIPAATCGLLGLKTTHGLLSTEGVYPLAPSLDGVGILTRSAGDAQQMLTAIVDADHLVPLTDQPIRLASWLPAAGLHPEVSDAFQSVLQRIGATLMVPAAAREWPHFKAISELAEIVLYTEAAQTHQTSLSTASAGVRAVAEPGRSIPNNWYRAALADRSRRVTEFVGEQLRDCDFFLMPALAQPIPDWDSVVTTSPSFEGRQLLGLHRFMGAINYLGCPSLVLPISRDSRGLPISVQIVARPFHEMRLLAFAARLEHELGVGFGLTTTRLASERA